MGQSPSLPRDRAVEVFAERLTELIGGDTWYAVSQRTGVHETSLKQLARGEREPKLSTLVKLVHGLGLHSLDELLGPLPAAALRATTGEK